MRKSCNARPRASLSKPVLAIARGGTTAARARRRWSTKGITRSDMVVIVPQAYMAHLSRAYKTKKPSQYSWAYLNQLNK
jgi:hypothetical protein